MIRILIADDHALIRSGLAQIIATADDMMVAAEAASGAEVLELTRNGNHRFDILLLDISMPGANGSELIKLLREESPQLPILILSMHNEGQIVRRTLAAGAGGYISKSSDMRMLMDAIRKVAGGGRFIDPALVDVALFDSAAHRPSPQELLTKRELLILRLIVAGQPISAIALQLHLSPKTVSTHKMRLMKKLRIDNNAELVLFAARHQLAEAGAASVPSFPAHMPAK
ncbi:MAG TPA: response regulator transcription factor [Burkholderiaceae bacterium]|nr:response regulator transcription factor [Burkholderiaceae bacterium]